MPGLGYNIYMTDSSHRPTKEADKHRESAQFVPTDDVTLATNLGDTTDLSTNLIGRVPGATMIEEVGPEVTEGAIWTKIGISGLQFLENLVFLIWGYWQLDKKDDESKKIWEQSWDRFFSRSNGMNFLYLGVSVAAFFIFAPAILFMGAAYSGIDAITQAVMVSRDTSLEQLIENEERTQGLIASQRKTVDEKRKALRQFLDSPVDDVNTYINIRDAFFTAQSELRRREDALEDLEDKVEEVQGDIQGKTNDGLLAGIGFVGAALLIFPLTAIIGVGVLAGVGLFTLGRTILNFSDKPFKEAIEAKTQKRREIEINQDLAKDDLAKATEALSKMSPALTSEYYAQRYRVDSLQREVADYREQQQKISKEIKILDLKEQQAEAANSRKLKKALTVAAIAAGTILCVVFPPAAVILFAVGVACLVAGAIGYIVNRKKEINETNSFNRSIAEEKAKPPAAASAPTLPEVLAPTAQQGSSGIVSPTPVRPRPSDLLSGILARSPSPPRPQPPGLPEYSIGEEQEPKHSMDHEHGHVERHGPVVGLSPTLTPQPVSQHTTDQSQTEEPPPSQHPGPHQG